MTTVLSFVVVIGVLLLLFASEHRQAGPGGGSGPGVRRISVGERTHPRSMTVSAPAIGVAVLALVLITPTVWRLLT